jgi:hypothetical protein
VKVIFYSFVFFFFLNVNAQNQLRQSAWQQKVDSRIYTVLDTITHTIHSKIEMDYYNNSPDTLKSLLIHLWPNAYKDVGSSFAQQELQKNKTQFATSKVNEKGWIDGLDFKVGSDKLSWKSYQNMPDVIELELNKPLLPNQMLQIVTPFRVQIPSFFSRSGHTDGFYALTQWFPKPAVYDVNGWNPMPYLDQGEFYSEFGNYHVEISVPYTYEVASSGHLVSKIDSNVQITYVMEENNCHDFAWFASNSFLTTSAKIGLSQNDSVEITAYVLPSSKMDLNPVLFAAKSALVNYSKWVGMYPYKTCKVVIGNIVAGAGMEYPGITICSDASPTTVIHEVGHNWFYGVLGNNERKYPWMDESINSYFDKRASNEYDVFLGKEILNDPDFFNPDKKVNWFANHISLLSAMYLNANSQLQRISDSSYHMTNTNYGMMYGRGAISFAYLNEMLGDSVFLQCFKTYYEKWKFKHPLPKDMQDVFEEVSGKKLNWFFEDVLSDDGRIDIVKKNGKITVKGSEGLNEWYAKSNEKIPNSNAFLLESNYRNNGQKMKLMKVRIPFGIPTASVAANVNLTPVVGYNFYDRIYAGFNINNAIVQLSRFSYQLMPVYSFHNKKLRGFYKINYRQPIRKGKLRQFDFGLFAQEFGLENSLFNTSGNAYQKAGAELRFDFDRPNSKMEAYEQFLSIRNTNTRMRNPDRITYRGDANVLNTYESYRQFSYINVRYLFDNKKLIDRVLVDLNVEMADNFDQSLFKSNYSKAFIELGYKTQYSKKKRFFRTKLFAGAFLSKNNVQSQQSFWMSSNGGFLDYQYRNANIARGESAFNSDIVLGKYFNGPGLRNNLLLQNSDQWMTTLKTDFDFPQVLPLRFYFDCGIYRYKDFLNGQFLGLSKAEFYYTGGIEFFFFKNTLEVFVPVLFSSQFEDFTSKIKAVNSIGFKLNLNQFYLPKVLNNAIKDQGFGFGTDF